MFELLLLIYLLPVIFVAALLLKLALWLVKKIFQLAGWLIKHLCVLVWKCLLLILGVIVGARCINRPPGSR